MIKILIGIVEQAKPGFILIQTPAGVGYQVFMNHELLNISEEDDIKIYTHMAVRENSITLYGFTDFLHLEVFELLITVSGVGPKVALNILSISTPESIKRSVVTADTSELTKVSGIGKRVAEKIILELKNKISTLSISDSTSKDSFDIEIYETLESMGFSRNDIRKALENLPKEKLSTEEKIKQSLKLLAK